MDPRPSLRKFMTNQESSKDFMDQGGKYTLVNTRKTTTCAQVVKYNYQISNFEFLGATLKLL
jgi:hypothetical protein